MLYALRSSSRHTLIKIWTHILETLLICSSVWFEVAPLFYFRNTSINGYIISALPCVRVVVIDKICLCTWTNIIILYPWIVWLFNYIHIREVPIHIQTNRRVITWCLSLSWCCMLCYWYLRADRILKLYKHNRKCQHVQCSRPDDHWDDRWACKGRTKYDKRG